MKKKVRIEITKDQCEIFVQIGDKTHKETHYRTRYGSESRGELLSDNPAISEDVNDALQGFDFHDIMIALHRDNIWDQ
jgi:hypothetical protein